MQSYHVSYIKELCIPNWLERLFNMHQIKSMHARVIRPSCSYAISGYTRVSAWCSLCYVAVGNWLVNLVTNLLYQSCVVRLPSGY